MIHRESLEINKNITNSDIGTQIIKNIWLRFTQVYTNMIHLRVKYNKC